MRDLRRISGLAIGLIVLLRMAIGWQFLYEGLWKLDSQDTSQPWSAEGYLKNARGPLRPFFRSLTGDPDDLDWLNYQKMKEKWDRWYQRFLSHYDLNKEQQERLNELVNGRDDFRAILQELPDGVEFRGSLGRVIEFWPERNRLVVDGQWHLTPRERERLLNKVSLHENPENETQERHNELARKYKEAVIKVYKRSSRLSFQERLAALLRGDPERNGEMLVLKESGRVVKRLPLVEVVSGKNLDDLHKAGQDLVRRPGEIQKYKSLLERYERDRARADEDFQWKHLEKQWRDIQQLRAELVGPVKSLEEEMKQRARELLTAEQLARGPVGEPWTRMRLVNVATMWSLTILGVLLIVGLISPISAIAAAGLLTMFYLAMPPWPGVPQPQGPEHAYIINKNLIEALALLAIATLPTGRWFGIDAALARFFTRNKTT